MNILKKWGLLGLMVVSSLLQAGILDVWEVLGPKDSLGKSKISVEQVRRIPIEVFVGVGDSGGIAPKILHEHPAHRALAKLSYCLLREFQCDPTNNSDSGDFRFSEDGKYLVRTHYVFTGEQGVVADQDVVAAHEMEPKEVKEYWDIATGDQLSVEAVEQLKALAAEDVCGDGCSGCALCDVLDGLYVQEEARGKTVIMTGVSPDGQFLITVSDDGGICIWAAKDRREVHRFQFGEHIHVFDFSPDSKQMLTLNFNEHCIRVWDIATGKEIARLENSFGFNSARFSPDGKYVLTTLWDDGGTVLFLDIATGAAVGGLPLIGESINNASFSPDGKKILASSGNRAFLFAYDAISEALQEDVFFLKAHLTVEQTLFLLLLYDYVAAPVNDAVVALLSARIGKELTREEIIEKTCKRGMCLHDIAQKCPQVDYDELGEILNSFSPASRTRIIEYYAIHDARPLFLEKVLAAVPGVGFMKKDAVLAKCIAQDWRKAVVKAPCSMKM